MDTAMLIEIFGYIGSALVVISMLMSSIVKLRVINIIGSVISGTYAIICGAFPLVLMNGCLIVINVYNLYKLFKTEQKYDMFEGKADDSFVQFFLNGNKEDIKTFFPEFKGSSDAQYAYTVCCEGAPAGILLGTKKENGVFEVVIDYTTPAYRDCSVGKFLYGQLPNCGINTLVSGQKADAAHVSYLEKMGFKKENGSYVKKLK